jgi:hypothetical protein
MLLMKLLLPASLRNGRLQRYVAHHAVCDGAQVEEVVLAVPPPQAVATATATTAAPLAVLATSLVGGAEGGSGKGRGGHAV